MRVRQPPGRATVGFQLETELEAVPGSARWCERRDGRVVGELAVEPFTAALIIDRDGILETKASGAAGTPAVRVTLPGASGYRAEAVSKAALPYLYVFAIAPDDLAVDGGVLVTVRSATPNWPAAEAMLRSLRLLTRHGVAPANDDAPPLPLIGK